MLLFLLEVPLDIDQIAIREVCEVDMLQVKELVPNDWDFANAVESVLFGERSHV